MHPWSDFRCARMHTKHVLDRAHHPVAERHSGAGCGTAGFAVTIVRLTIS